MDFLDEVDLSYVLCWLLIVYSVFVYTKIHVENNARLVIAG